MTEFATRGELAFALFKALGIEAPSSSGTFTDSGPLDGILSTLSDIGVTNGVAEGLFGTAQQTTRGQAFTMVARALGLADNNTSIEEASQALVLAGIVKGFGNDPGNLGLNDPLQTDHLSLLINRVKPELEKPVDLANPSAGTVGDRIMSNVAAARDDNLRANDGGFASFLRGAGLRRDQITDEIAFRIDQTNSEISRRAAGFERAGEQANEDVGQDFANRGVFRGGERVLAQAEATADVDRQRLDFEAAQRQALTTGNRTLETEREDINFEEAERRLQAETAASERSIQASI
ncbi:MAG: hypothetical protein V3U14_12845 [candidate division NC10 bacterium]